MLFMLLYIIKHLLTLPTYMFSVIMKTAMTDREHQHQRLYLEMYRKGQESARFEREEEVSESLHKYRMTKFSLSE